MHAKAFRVEALENHEFSYCAHIPELSATIYGISEQHVTDKAIAILSRQKELIKDDMAVLERHSRKVTGKL